MSQLIQLRQHIFSIKKTCKITRAMRLMAMSLYNKLEKQNVAVSRYRKQITGILTDLSRYTPEWKNTILFPEDILDAKPLIILITSSRGLCGGFNTHLIRYFEERFSLEEHQTPTFITIGNKGRDFLAKKNFQAPLKHYDELSSTTFIDIAQDLTDHIILSPEPYTSVTAFTNLLKNFFVQSPTKKSFLPLDSELFISMSGVPEKVSGEVLFEEEPIWEQEKEEVMNFIGIAYLRSIIAESLLESLLAEQAARFIAMDQSTTNAEKYLEKLQLQYNKSRQAFITSEVAELSTGFTQMRT